jgi:hypothetical protein
VATKAADNGGRAAAVEKHGFCVFSILMSKKEAVCPDSRIVPAVFRVSGFYCNSLCVVFHSKFHFPETTTGGSFDGGELVRPLYFVILPDSWSYHKNGQKIKLANITLP